MPTPAPELMDDAIGEIFLRIPPDDPALLLRASFVCKVWRRLLTDPAFLRRYRAFHRKSLVLGFFCNTDLASRFVSLSTFRPRNPERRNCDVLDCRHGRALLYDYTTENFLIWDPVTGEDKRIPVPHYLTISHSYNAAVLCAAADCDHLCCHGGPFLVVLAATYILEKEAFAGASVYSSEAGEWSTPTTIWNENDFLYYNYIANLPAVLAGDSIYFIWSFGRALLRYDFRGERGLSVIDAFGPVMYMHGTIVPMPANDGGTVLRLACLEGYKINLWLLGTMDPDEDAAWTQRGVIQLDQVLKIANSLSPPKLVGFANTSVGDVVFVGTEDGIFTIDLESQKCRKVNDKDCGDGPIFPYASFVTPDCAVGRLSLPQQ